MFNKYLDDMRFYPILFSTPMVQSIDADIKTQTRRLKNLEVINKDPEAWLFAYLNPAGTHAVFNHKFKAETLNVKLPYGSVGDVMWVRETWGKELTIFDDTPKQTVYKALHVCAENKWKPAIHMPKPECRTFLQTHIIRCERLNNISEMDSIAEGVLPIGESSGNILYKNYMYSEISKCIKPSHSFMSLWKHIYGEESWSSNPWVFVYQFEKTLKPINFLS